MASPFAAEHKPSSELEEMMALMDELGDHGLFLQTFLYLQREKFFTDVAAKEKIDIPRLMKLFVHKYLAGEISPDLLASMSTDSLLVTFLLGE